MSEKDLKFISKKVYDILDDIGVRSNLTGYYYLSYGINYLLENPLTRTTSIYRLVAEEFNSTSSKVDRCMRHAIENLFSHIYDETVYQYFGNSLGTKKKPTNSQFLYAVAQYIRRNSSSD